MSTEIPEISGFKQDEINTNWRSITHANIYSFTK